MSRASHSEMADDAIGAALGMKNAVVVSSSTQLDDSNPFSKFFTDAYKKASNVQTDMHAVIYGWGADTNHHHHSSDASNTNNTPAVSTPYVVTRYEHVDASNPRWTSTRPIQADTKSLPRWVKSISLRTTPASSSSSSSLPLLLSDTRDEIHICQSLQTGELSFFSPVLTAAPVDDELTYRASHLWIREPIPDLPAAPSVTELVFRSSCDVWRTWLTDTLNTLTLQHPTSEVLIRNTALLKNALPRTQLLRILLLHTVTMVTDMLRFVNGAGAPYAPTQADGTLAPFSVDVAFHTDLMRSTLLVMLYHLPRWLQQDVFTTAAGLPPMEREIRDWASKLNSLAFDVGAAGNNRVAIWSIWHGSAMAATGAYGAPTPSWTEIAQVECENGTTPVLQRTIDTTTGPSDTWTDDDGRVVRASPSKHDGAPSFPRVRRVCQIHPRDLTDETLQLARPLAGILGSATFLL